MKRFLIEKKNEVKLYLTIEENDKKDDIYFLDGSETHDNLKELNEKNTKLYIYKDKCNKNNEYEFTKKFIFDFKGDYKILLKLELGKEEKLTDSSFMFYKCSKLKNIDLTFFDASNIINMSNMFAYCENLEKIDLSFFDASNVTDMSSTFKGCKNLKEINLSSFKTIQVKNMSNMFEDCENLEAIDLSSFDTSNVENMSFMFKGCKKLKDINLSSFKILKVKNVCNMFEDCENLENVYSFTIPEGVQADNVFKNCKKYIAIKGGENENFQKFKK